jgi:hypothetical protein
MMVVMVVIVVVTVTIVPRVMPVWAIIGRGGVSVPVITAGQKEQRQRTGRDHR